MVILFTYLYDDMYKNELKQDTSSKKLNYNFSNINIVEIGGGYGNCIRLINNIIYYKKYTIIDLPYMLELQKYFLKNEINNIENIEFINGLNNLYDYSKMNINLVIATHSLSELDYSKFIYYMNNVVNKSLYFYYGYNKNCPSKKLIDKKLEYILNNNYIIINSYEYTEKTSAEVKYILFKNKGYTKLETEVSITNISDN